ncbi:MAG TPA: replicative DNA helicase [Gemmataceae bacterium]|nr:replicative DNA helicase [Gemmataceae bacterium]
MTDLTPERLPPQNLGAERAVLGSMLRNNDCIGEVSLLLTAQSFYLDANRKIYQAILDAHGDAGRPVDLVLLHDELHHRGQLDDIGRAAYLAELWDSAPTAANVLYYARLVRDRAMVREIIRASTETLRDAYEQNQPAEELLADAERRVLSIGELGTEGQTYTDAEILAECLMRIDSRRQKDGRLSGLSTGFDDLDGLLAGWQESELVIVAARPSVGKTAIGLTFAANVVFQLGRPVFIASMEQSRHELMERLLCAQAQVDSHRIRRGCQRPEEDDRLADAAQGIARGLLHIDDRAGQSMLRIAANARRLKRKYGIALVVVDYLQLIEPENRRDPRHEQVGQISRRLKGLARDLRMPVLALAQLNRESENRAGQRPRLSDLRESGSIEADADTVILLHRPRDNDERLDLLIEKQRNGPTGEVSLYFRRDLMRFEEAVAVPFR